MHLSPLNLPYAFGDLLRCFGRMPRCLTGRTFGEKYAAEVDRKYTKFDFAKEYEAILDDLNFEACGFDRIVDYGCNTGLTCAMLSRRYECTQIFGFDVNRYALARAQQRVPWGSFCHISESDRCDTGSADLVLMTHSLAFIEDPVLALRDIHRMLKPTGVLVIVTPNARFLRAMVLKNLFTGYRSDQNRLIDYTQEGLTELLREAGLETLKIRATGELPHLPVFRSDRARSRIVAVASKS